MRSHSEILKKLGPTAVATALGLPPSTVYSWDQRDSIPSKHWPEIVEFARKVRVSGVSYAALARAAAATEAGARPRARVA